MQKARSDRRRRWYLRWRSLLARVAPAGSANAPLSPSRNDAGALWDRFCRECRAPAGVTLSLSRADGYRIVMPLCDPCMLIGRGRHCTVQLDDAHVAETQAALVWHEGRLFLVDAGRQSAGWLSAASRSGWRCGRWTIEVIGLPAADSLTKPISPQQPVLSLEWSKPGPVQPTRLSRPVNVIGSAVACSTRLAVPGVAPLHALVLKMNASAWLVNLGVREYLQVNGQVIEFAPLDPGDVISFGPCSATVISQWNDEREQTVLTDLEARIAELEGRLRELKRMASLGANVQTELADIEQLADGYVRRLQSQSPCN